MRESCRRNVEQEDIDEATVCESSSIKHKSVPDECVLPEVMVTLGEKFSIWEGVQGWGGLWEVLKLFCVLGTGHMGVFTL